MPEMRMCLKRYISTCLKEKYLAKIKIRTILANPIGSKEKFPILYQDLVPLIWGAKKKSPPKSKREKTYKRRRK